MASATTTAAKQALRKQMHHALSRLSPQLISDQSLQVAKHVLKNPLYQASKHISIYISMDSGELQTRMLIDNALETGKTVYVPRCKRNVMDMVAIKDRNDLDSLLKNKWGIPEPTQDRVPVDPRALDFIVVPGVAFDKSGNRCGHGRGYYDRFLLEAQNAYSCAVCLSDQVVDSVPIDSFDKTPDIIIAPEGPIYQKDSKQMV